MEILNLKKITVFAVRASIDEKSFAIKGYYQDKNIAGIDSKKAGWFGSDGEVIEVTIYQDEHGNIYKVEELGMFKDKDREYKDEVLNKIKSKLTGAEREFLGL
jgi:hypothetical protein